MSFSLTPSTVAPLASLTATGTGARKRQARIRVASTDPVAPGQLLAEFTIGGAGRFSRLINAPAGPDRSVKLVLQQPRADGVWAQTASADLTLLAAAGGGSGGGTPTPTPNPPPAGDVTAPVPSNVRVENANQTEATISWSLPEGGTGQVEFGATTAYGSVSALEPSYLTFHRQAIAGLTPGQTYHFRVRSVDAAGNVGLSPDGQFTTTPAAQLPGAPTRLVATGGDGRIDLAWLAPASNGGSAISGYRVYRNGVLLVTLGAVTTYANTGLANGQSYTYTVAAVTAAGEGPQSAAASATTNAAGDVNAPNVSSVGSGPATTTTCPITCATDEPATVVVRFGTTAAYGSSTSPTSLDTSHSRTLTGLTPNLTYHFQIVATDAAGNVRYDQDRTFTTAQTTPAPSNGLPAEGSLKYFPWSVPALPAKGVRYADQTGTKGVRYTDANHGPLYAKRNIDSAGGTKLFDGYTGQIHRGTFPYDQLSSPGNYGNFNWDPVDDDIGWATDNSDGTGKLRKIDFSNPASPNELPGVYPAGEHITLTAEGVISRNGRFVEMSIDRPGWVRVVDVNSGALSSFWNLGGVPDSVTMSKDGNYVVANFEPQSTGFVNQIRAYNIDGTGAHQVNAEGRHGDTGVFGGIQYWVGAGGRAWRLDRTHGVNQVVVNLFPTGHAFDSCHVSCAGPEDWALFSEMNPQDNIGKLGNGHIVAVKLDGSQTVMDFGNSYSVGAGGNDAYQPQACWSRDGRLVFFKRFQSGAPYGMVLGMAA